MAVVYISPVGGVAAQFFDNSGNVLTGGKLYTYQAGTTTPQASYTTSAGNVARTNPIVLNAAGRVPDSGEIWITSQAYKFVLETSTNVLIATYDNVVAAGSGAYTVQNFTGDGTTVAFTLTNAPASENSTNVYINGVYQQKNTYSLAGVVLTFSQAPPVTSTIEVNYI
jgi:hypothetical protein